MKARIGGFSLAALPTSNASLWSSFPTRLLRTMPEILDSFANAAITSFLIA